MPNNALGSAQWLPDDAAKNCMRCGEEFTAWTRRHHCRQCGQLFCHRCCNSKALLQPGSGTAPEDRVAAHPVLGAGETDPRKPQKVCGKCFELLLPMQPYLTATNSKAMLQPDFSEASMSEWAGKPVSRSFKLEIKKAVHTLNSFLGLASRPKEPARAAPPRLAPQELPSGRPVRGGARGAGGCVGGGEARLVLVRV